MIKLSDIVSKKVVKNTELKTLNRKVNRLEKESPEAATLLHIT